MEYKQFPTKITFIYYVLELQDIHTDWQDFVEVGNTHDKIVGMAMGKPY